MDRQTFIVNYDNLFEKALKNPLERNCYPTARQIKKNKMLMNELEFFMGKKAKKAKHINFVGLSRKEAMCPFTLELFKNCYIRIRFGKKICPYSFEPCLQLQNARLVSITNASSRSKELKRDVSIA